MAPHMPTSFTSLIQTIADASTETFETPDDWRQGRTLYGGLSAAFCLVAARRLDPMLASLRSALVAFIGPAEGRMRTEARVLRAGKSVAYVEADLIAEKGLATRALFAFGAERASAFDHDFIPSTDLPDPADRPPYFVGAGGPAFLQHFDARLVDGAAPVTGSAAHRLVLWARHRDEAARSIEADLAIADMPPPALMPMFTAPAPISSMTWIVNFLRAPPSDDDGWRLIETRAEHARGGYSSQDMIIRLRSGAALMTARQQVAVFA